MNFRERKQERVVYYNKYVKGWRLMPCMACSGSGKYDWARPNGYVPNCAACGGSGKTRVSPEEYKKWKKFNESISNK